VSAKVAIVVAILRCRSDEPRRRSHRDLAGQCPGARSDALGGSRCGYDAARVAAEAGRPRLWARGAVRTESAIRLGLRARTDETQSAQR
jgi:hypothetical protein